MTVCVASLFRWNYAPSTGEAEFRVAAIALSDRMITAGDVQYEPQQQKVAYFGARAILMIAGDYSLHSQAIQEAQRQLRGNNAPLPWDVATLYGRTIQAIKHRQAEAIYLAPLGLNMDTFLAQQKDMSERFVSSITDQLQRYEGADIEALVVGLDLNGEAHIYMIDSQGLVSCLDDVGFGAIGMGAWHAKSRLMQAGYVNSTTFPSAIAAAFAAKKARKSRLVLARILTSTSFSRMDGFPCGRRPIKSFMNFTKNMKMPELN